MYLRQREREREKREIEFRLDKRNVVTDGTSDYDLPRSRISRISVLRTSSYRSELSSPANKLSGVIDISSSWR